MRVKPPGSRLEAVLSASLEKQLPVQLLLSQRTELSAAEVKDLELVQAHLPAILS